MAMWDIRAQDMQDILDQTALSHAMLEHIRNLFRQIYNYAVQYELVAKDYSQYTRITKEDDDTQGVPFTMEDLQLLWEHKDLPFVDTILIYCYPGWRINELARMPLDSIDLEARTFTGGLKNRYSRNRTVPIHSAIFGMVYSRLDPQFKSLIYHDNSRDITEQYNMLTRAAGGRALTRSESCGRW